MIKVDVYVQEKRFKKYIATPEKYIKKKINKIKYLIPLLRDKNIIFSVLISGNKDIKKLNKKFRGKNKATDVLSFPFYKREELKKIIRLNKNIYLGDIILNHYKIKNSSKENFKKDFDRLWVHGLLHLIGYRHSQNKDFNKMNKLETNILNKFQNDKFF